MIVAKLNNNSTVYVELTQEQNTGNYFCEVYFDALKKDYIDCFTILAKFAPTKAEAIKRAINRCKIIGK